jgi:hypothetical protein
MRLRAAWTRIRAGMFYGNVWKKVAIERPEYWIGIRSDPTFSSLYYWGSL